MTVFEFPPMLSLRSHVSIEFLERPVERGTKVTKRVEQVAESVRGRGRASLRRFGALGAFPQSTLKGTDVVKHKKMQIDACNNTQHDNRTALTHR